VNVDFVSTFQHDDNHAHKCPRSLYTEKEKMDSKGDAHHSITRALGLVVLTAGFLALAITSLALPIR